MDRCVCAPQSEPGGIESEPKESLSMRDGRDVTPSIVTAAADGRMVERMPGVKVAGAKTFFMVVIVARYMMMVRSLGDGGGDGG